MADLGEIGRFGLETYRKTTRSWTDATKSIRASVERVSGFALAKSGATPRATVVSGTVKQNGSSVSRLVRVYRRDTGELLSSVNSQPDGTFTMQLNGYSGLVFVIAFDDTGTAPDFNAAIYDLVEPA